jgi:hypothetical protein
VVRTFPHPDSIVSVAISRDGRFAASGTGAGGTGPEIRFLDLIAGKELHAIRVGEAGEYSLNAVAFLPDGRTVLSGHPDGILKAWDVETGRVLRTLRSTVAGTVDIRYIAISPDGRRAVTTGLGAEGPVVWDLEHGRILRQFEQRAGQQPSFSAAVSAGRFNWRYYLVQYDEMRMGDSGLYVGPEDGSKGFDLCMMIKQQMNSNYRDPYLYAVFKRSGAVAKVDVEDPWHTGYETQERWLTLRTSGARLRCLPEGFVLRRTRPTATLLPR